MLFVNPQEVKEPSADPYRPGLVLPHGHRPHVFFRGVKDLQLTTPIIDFHTSAR
jgi:hypothetical protein